jgi:hypothetical protein
MAYIIVYFVKLYSIPSCLMVNNDQIRIHHVPTKDFVSKILLVYLCSQIQ